MLLPAKIEHAYHQRSISLHTVRLKWLQFLFISSFTMLGKCCWNTFSLRKFCTKNALVSLSSLVNKKTRKCVHCHGKRSIINSFSWKVHLLALCTLKGRGCDPTNLRRWFTKKLNFSSTQPHHHTGYILYNACVLGHRVSDITQHCNWFVYDIKLLHVFNC